MAAHASREIDSWTGSKAIVQVELTTEASGGSRRVWLVLPSPPLGVSSSSQPLSPGSAAEAGAAPCAIPHSVHVPSLPTNHLG